MLLLPSCLHHQKHSSLLCYSDCFYFALFFSFIGRIRPASPYVGSLQPARGAYVGGFGYQQPVSYSYQQGLVYPPYGWVGCRCTLSQNEHLLWRFVCIAKNIIILLVLCTCCIYAYLYHTFNILLIINSYVFVNDCWMTVVNYVHILAWTTD